MAHIQDRATNFAKKFVKEKAPVDNRSTDEKLAEFSKKYMPDRLKEQHRAMKRKRKES